MGDERLADMIATMVVQKLTPRLEAIVRSVVSERNSRAIVADVPKIENKRWTKWWEARCAAGEKRITEVKAPNGAPGRKKYRAVLECCHERLLAFSAVDGGKNDAPPPETPEDTVGMTLTCEVCRTAYDANYPEPPRRAAPK